ncbi:triose-phosphate isomerase family protein [Planctomonas psychrotolerans]|uniref:triose-phosphate isomerase family protein n=1 Tax=Planctomonas psychrotolerans TaxID=2528712 RepID=UPI00123C684C|nr:triose-phosphate isomerase family protein [Planctomonas psychrotolerans]
MGATGLTYVGVSTKMYLGYAASVTWLERVAEVVAARPALADDARTALFVAPSFPVLESARRILADTPVWLGAQNCSDGDGALTGEVSAGMLAELGVRLVEIGHAERRALYGEDDAVVARKTRAVLAAGMSPLLCIGEGTRTDADSAARVCADQVLSARVDADTQGDTAGAPAIVLAYEPVWAIGAAEPAEPAYVDDVVSALRDRLRERGAGSFDVLYGGSAGPGLFLRLTSVDGLFLGRFAHDPANLGVVLDEALAVAASRAAG